MIRHLDRLVTRDQGRERDDAAVARGEPLPHITQQAVLV
jgi:hypothetical protein